MIHSNPQTDRPDHDGDGVQGEAGKSQTGQGENHGHHGRHQRQSGQSPRPPEEQERNPARHAGRGGLGAVMGSKGLKYVSIDAGNERVGGKIKSAQEDKVPYMLVVGGKDAEAGTVSVRHRSEGEMGAVKLDDFVFKVIRERDTQSLGPITDTVA